MFRWRPCHRGGIIKCKTDIHSRPLSGFPARAVFFSADPERDFLVLKPWKTHTDGVYEDVNIVPYFCGIWMDHVPLCTHIYLFFFPLPEECQGGRCPAHRKKIICGERRGEEVERGGEEKKYMNMQIQSQCGTL